jgi:hypothetical protein
MNSKTDALTDNMIVPTAELMNGTAELPTKKKGRLQARF